MERSGRNKALLVDDNPRVRSFVRPALEDAGFHCIEAEDGWTALETLERESPTWWYWTSCWETRE